MKSLATMTLAAAILGGVACSTMPQTEGAISSSVFGTMELPGDTVPQGNSVLLVSLVEIASDSILAQERILNLEEYPIAFTLRYDPNLVRDNETYGVSAALYIDGLLRYNNDPTVDRVASNRFTQTVTVVLQRAD